MAQSRTWWYELDRRNLQDGRCRACGKEFRVQREQWPARCPGCDYRPKADRRCSPLQLALLEAFDQTPAGESLCLDETSHLLLREIHMLLDVGFVCEAQAAGLQITQEGRNYLFERDMDAAAKEQTRELDLALAEIQVQTDNNPKEIGSADAAG